MTNRDEELPELEVQKSLLKVYISCEEQLENGKCDKNANKSKDLKLSSISDKNATDEDCPPEPRVQTGWKRYIGIWFGLCASFAFAAAMIFVKVLPSYDSSTLSFWRFAVSFILNIPLILYYRFGPKKDLFEPIWPMTAVKAKIAALLVLRGICGGSSMILLIYAIQYIELPDALVISLSTPVFVSLVARIFLGETCGIVPTLSALLTFIGVTIIARPPALTGAKEFDLNTLIGTALSLMVMIVTATIFIVLRYLRGIHFTLVMFVLGLVGMIESAILCFATSKFEVPHSWLDLVYAFCSGLFSLVGYILLTGALKFEQAGPIALIRTSDVVFAFILQMIFLGIYPDIFSLVGTSFVVVAVVIIVIRKGLSTLPKGDKSIEKYWCFLK